MMDNIIHFLKHAIGLCGESHPSLLVSGGILFISISIWFKQIINYIRDLF